MTVYKTIKNLQESYKNNITTPKEYIKNLLETIQDLDKDNQSIVSIDKVLVESLLQNLEDNYPTTNSLPLWGIPCLIKDNILLEGQEVNAQSKILKGYIAPYTSDVARKLIEAGAIIIGRTNMDEFAFGSSTEFSGFGQVTKNAHDTTKVAGGTSGGSAVAIALGLVPFALGSDTGGSIRQPASFNGIYGLRPTYGSVSRYGVIASASSFDQVGPLANCLEDIELVYSILKGKEVNDQTSINLPDLIAISKPRIGIAKEFLENLNPEVKEAFDELINKVKNSYDLVEIELPHTKYILPVYYILQTVEASSNLERFDQVRFARSVEILESKDLYYKARETELGDETKRRIMLGTYTSSAGYYDAYYNQACKVRKIIQDEYQLAFTKIDALIMPACPFPAWDIGGKTDDPMAMYTADIMTVSQPIAKLPALVVPLAMSNNLPVGLQIVAKENNDINLLAIAKLIEEL